MMQLLCAPELANTILYALPINYHLASRPYISPFAPNSNIQYTSEVIKFPVLSPILW